MGTLKNSFLTRSIAFDGNHYYICKISLFAVQTYLIKLNKDFSFNSQAVFSKRLLAIAYDGIMDRLIFSEGGKWNSVGFLNKDLTIEGCQKLKSAQINSNIVGLDRDIDSGEYLIAYKQKIIRFSEKGIERKIEKRCGAKEEFRDVISVTPYIGILSRKKKGSFLYTLDRYGKQSIISKLEKEMAVLSIAYIGRDREKVEWIVLGLEDNGDIEVEKIFLEIEKFSGDVKLVNFKEQDNVNEKTIFSLIESEIELAKLLEVEVKRVEKILEKEDVNIENNDSVKLNIDKMKNIEEKVKETLK